MAQAPLAMTTFGADLYQVGAEEQIADMADLRFQLLALSLSSMIFACSPPIIWETPPGSTNDLPNLLPQSTCRRLRNSPPAEKNSDDLMSAPDYNAGAEADDNKKNNHVSMERK